MEADFGYKSASPMSDLVCDCEKLQTYCWAKGEVAPPISAEDRNIDFATAPAEYTRADIDSILKPILDGIEVHINQTDDGWMLAIDKCLARCSRYDYMANP